MLHRFARRLKVMEEQEGEGFTLIELLIVVFLQFHKRKHVALQCLARRR